MNTWPPTVAPSTRAAMFTALPTTAYLARCSEPMLPTTASPVLTPIPISKRGSPARACSRFSSDMARCMASAQAAARSACSGCARGAPNTGDTAVGDERCEGAAMLHDDVGHAGQVLVQHVHAPRRVALLGEPGVAAEIRHQHGPHALLTAEAEAFRRFQELLGDFGRHVAPEG